MIQKGDVVTVVDDEKMWTKCTNQDFMRDCAVDPGNFEQGRRPSGLLVVLGLAWYERSDRTYLGLRDKNGFEYLCNVGGVEAAWDGPHRLSEAGARLAIAALEGAPGTLASDIALLRQMLV